MIINLHVLRGIAALMVTFHHMIDILYRNEAVPFASTHGRLGVDLFFIISGFIIVVANKQNVSALVFMTKRIFRIVPIYWVATLAVFTLIIAQNQLNVTDNIPGMSDLLSSLFFVPYEKENGLIRPILFVGWTLQYEMLFYALFALALKLSPYARPALTTGFLLSLFYLAGLFIPTDSAIIWFFTQPIFLTFAGGLILAEFWQRKDELVEHIGPAVAPIMGVAGIALFAVHPEHNPFISGIGATLIVGAALIYEVKGRQFRSRTAQFFGDISYSLYLIHAIVFYGVESVMAKLGLLSSPAWLLLAMGVSFAATCLVSWISYKVIELPVGRLARQRTRKSPVIQAAAPSST